MTDSEIEMLRLASQAAGYEFTYTGGRPLIRQADGVWESWNPLAYSSQALELSVVLGIDVVQYKHRRIVEAWPPIGPDAEEPYGEDPLAATRLAIVRAAASMAQGEKV